MAVNEPRPIQIPDFLPSNMDGGIGEAIEGVGRDLDDVARGARDVAMTMQSLENEEVEQLTRDGLSDFETHTYEKQLTAPGTMNEESFNADLEEYISGSEDLQNNEKAADKFREAAKQRILRDWHKTEIGFKVRKVRGDQSDYNDKFFAPLAKEASVEYIEAAESVLSSLEYIEDLEASGAPPEHIEELKAKTTRNWMAVASRAADVEEFMLHSDELTTESGDVSLRIPSEWILNQKESYNKKTGMSLLGKDLAEAGLRDLELGKLLRGKQLEIMATAREADPEFGAKYISSSMIGMSDVVWPSVAPEKWDAMLEYIDPKNGAFNDPRHDKSSVDEEFGQTLNAIWETATSNASPEELALLSKVQAPKKFYDHIKSQIEGMKKEAARGYPAFLAKRNSKVAEQHSILYNQDGSLNMSTSPEMKSAARTAIYQMAGRIDEEGNDIPGAENRNWAFGLDQLNTVLNDWENQGVENIQIALEDYYAANGSTARAFLGIEHMLGHQDEAEITQGEYAGYSLAMFSTVAQNQPLDDQFAQTLYKSLDPRWKKRLGETPREYAAYQNQFRITTGGSNIASEFIRSLGTMQDFSGHPELQMALEGMITDVAIYVEQTNPGEGWAMVDRYIDRNFTNVPINTGSEEFNKAFEYREWYYFFGKKSPQVRQDESMLLPRHFLDERTMGFFDRLRTETRGSAKREQLNEWLGQAILVPLERPDGSDQFAKWRLPYADLDMPMLDSMLASEMKTMDRAERKEIEKAISGNLEERNWKLVSKYASPSFGTNSKGEPVLFFNLASKDATIPQPLTANGKRVEYPLNDMLDNVIESTIGYKFEFVAGKLVRAGTPFTDYFLGQEGEDFREMLDANPALMQEMQNRFGVGGGAFQFGESQREFQKSNK